MQPLQPGTPRPHADAGLTMPRENFRLNQLSPERTSGESVEITDQRQIQHALTDAWQVLSNAGFTRFGGVVRLRPLDFAEHVRATQPDQIQPLSQALDTIAWHQFNQLEGTPDKAVQFLQRANLLSPTSTAILFHLIDSTLFLNDSHLWRIADPAIRRTTLQGYWGSAQDTILYTLSSAFGISENILRGRTSPSIETSVAGLSKSEKHVVFDLMGKLATLCNLSGTDRERLGLLNLSIAASSCQLAMLGHGRDLKMIVAHFIDRLGECENSADIETFLQVKSPLILNILSQLGATTWNKGNLLSAHLKNAPDQISKAAMQKDCTLMHCLSEDIDAILDLIEPLR